MADPNCRLTGGELNAAISNAVTRIHSQYLGRGPTKARTFHRENTIVSIIEDALTKAERTLAAKGRQSSVLAMRQDFQLVMRDDLVAEIERLTGRKVTAFMSANHIDPDLGAETFILDGLISGEVADAQPSEG